MNRLKEKLLEAVSLQKDTFNISSVDEAELYIRGFLNGVRLQQNHNFLPFTNEEANALIQEARRIVLKPYYYTFGSDEGYPYPNGCVVVWAETLNQAHGLFKKQFPHPTDDETLFCAFYYTEEEWSKVKNKPPVKGEFYTR